MPRNPSVTFKEEVFAQESGEAFIVLVQLDHDDLENSIRVTTDPMETLPIAGVKGVVSNGEEFVAMPFEIVLPGQEPDSPPVSRVRMDNISRDIGAAIRQMSPQSPPPAATISVVLSSDPDAEEVRITGFKLTNIRMDVFTIEGELTLERTDLRPFPGIIFSPGYFPALH